MTKDEILKRVLENPNQKVKLAITDIDGILRGKYIHLDKFKSAVEGGFGFCNVVFGWDANDLAYEGLEYTGWHTGYPDADAFIDLKTFRQVPWDNGVSFFLADFGDLEICPRSLLKRQIATAQSLGLTPMFGQEFEWFNFIDTPDDLEVKSHVAPRPLTPGMFGYSLLRSSRYNDFFNDIFDLMAQFKVPIEGLHTETGPGVYEAAIGVSEALEAADRAVLFKGGVKEIGMRHGITPSFMAKWDASLPGCSGHLHQSMWKDGKNIFFNEGDTNNMSETMKSYLAGLIHCLPEILPMYAPTINSYKRLVEGAWAPTTVTWGIDNRTTAIRVLPGSAKSTRIEFRVTGSDVNPYLAMAANLAAGLYGVKNQLKLEIPATVGNGYRDESHGILARTLEEAALKMQQSKIANELFGEKFVTHFTDSRIWEWKQHLKAVTDWEIKRYFEII